MKLVMPRRRKGQSSPDTGCTRYQKMEEPIGHMISEDARIISNPERVSKFDVLYRQPVLAQLRLRQP